MVGCVGHISRVWEESEAPQTLKRLGFLMLGESLVLTLYP